MSDGFHKWKKALRKFGEHKEAALKLAAKSNSVGVHAQLSSMILANQQFHRKMLLKVILGVQYLYRQGLSLRGHNEDVESLEGNLFQLLLLQSRDCQEMNAWIHTKEYIPPCS